jgi:hypothetical protein
MDFILSGGALRSLVEFLAPKVSSALIASPKGADLEIVDAVEAKTAGLFLKGWGLKLASAFPKQKKAKKFEVNRAPIEGEWPWAVALRGKQWAFYILLREEPSEAMLAELHPIAGLISLWQEFQRMEATEDRLSRMSYMILATKSTLASIFEPMPLNYYASFLTDVLNESLFPRSLSIYKDEGGALALIEGDDPPPERKGIYSSILIPPPTPIVTKSDAPPYEVVLPIIEPYRLFCVTKWDKIPEQETMDFLELVSNLASRALTINKLKIESSNEQDRISSGKFTILSLSETLNVLKTRQNRRDLLSMAADIFAELGKVKESLLVAWDKEHMGYAPLDYRKNYIKTSFEPSILPSDRISCKAETPVFDLSEGGFAKLIKCPWPEMADMKLAFPIWDNGRMEGFIAVSSDLLKDGDKLSALKIVAQFTASALKNLE